MTDRKRYHDTREELRRVQRAVKHLTDAIRGLTNATLESRFENRHLHTMTRLVVYNAVADDRFWSTRGVQQIERQSFGER